MVYVVVGCQYLIGVVFLVSAASKLRSRAGLRGFGASLRQMRLLPSRGVGAVALLVAAAEAAVAVLLVAATALGPATASTAAVLTVGFTGALALLISFSAAILAAMHRGSRAPCRCFGTANIPLGGRHVLRNGVLAAAAGVGLAGAVGGTPPAPDLGGVVVGAAGGITLAVLTVVSDELVELFAPAVHRPGEVGARRR